MISDKLIGLAMVIYIVSFLLYLIYVINRKAGKEYWIGYLATGVSWLGVLIHMTGFGMRWYESYQLGFGRIPLSNMYESMVFFSWAVVFIYLILELKYKFRAIGTAATLLSALILGVLSLFDFPREIRPLMPALQSNWLTAHVMTSFFGYAAFTLGFGIGVLLLLKISMKNSKLASRLPPERDLDELLYKSVAIGFPLLTIGIFTGAVWANVAWGTYWSWDPKETWSLITWFVYATFLHFRLTRGWRGKKSAILSVVGFAVVLFTYFGVNYLISGLHSYAG